MKGRKMARGFRYHLVLELYSELMEKYCKRKKRKKSIKQCTRWRRTNCRVFRLISESSAVKSFGNSVMTNWKCVFHQLLTSVISTHTSLIFNSWSSASISSSPPLWPQHQVLSGFFLFSSWLETQSPIISPLSLQHMLKIQNNFIWKPSWALTVD